jgi:hypothetical protein
MIRIVALLVGVLALALAACSSSDPDEDEDPVDSGAFDPGEGTLALRISFDTDYADMLDGPPSGVFHGAVWPAEVVTPTGVTDDEAAFEYMHVDIDVPEDGSLTSVFYTTGLLPAGETYYVLGFIDANDSDPEFPDSGDPITMPAGGGNHFVVQADTALEAELVLDGVMF